MTYDSPDFEYFCYREDSRVEKGHLVWNQVIPDSRGRAAHPESIKGSSRDATFGDYFEACRTFLQRDHFSPLYSSVFQKTGQRVKPPRIQKIQICLKKHGEFYHPAKVTLLGDSVSERSVLNVALSEAGAKVLESEVYSLKRLRGMHPLPLIPTVFYSGTVSTPKRDLAMFLGDWFDGYHEFHLSLESPGNQARICVWDEDRGPYLLSEALSDAIYRQVAYILTAYYNPISFEEIRPWHHAAGDFVIRDLGKSVSVRLITVRGYKSMFQQSPGKNEQKANVEMILHALLLFFLNLSCRIRMDRDSGTGEWIWGEARCLDSAVQGFFDALEEKDVPGVFPGSYGDTFRAYLASLTQEDIAETLEAVSGRRVQNKEEAAFIVKHTVAHARQLWETLQKQL